MINSDMFVISYHSIRRLGGVGGLRLGQNLRLVLGYCRTETALGLLPQTRGKHVFH